MRSASDLMLWLCLLLCFTLFCIGDTTEANSLSTSSRASFLSLLRSKSRKLEERSYPALAPTPALGANDYFASGGFACPQSPDPSCLKWGDTSLFMKRIKNPLTWQCGRCMLTYGYGRQKGFHTVDDYNFKLSDAKQYYGNSAVKKYAQLTYLWRPHGCLATDTTNEWCDLTAYWREYNPNKDSGIPYCRQSFCWFKPGGECLARVWRWQNLEQWQKDLANSNLRAALQRIVSPIGTMVTKCFSKDKLKGRKCPIGNCIPTKRKRLIDLLTNKAKRATCSAYNCSSCMNPDASGRQCTGNDPWGNDLCCDCILEASYSFISFN